MKKKNTMRNHVIILVWIFLMAVGVIGCAKEAEEGHGDQEVAGQHSLHEGEADEEHSEAVRLSNEEMREFGVEVSEAGAGQLQVHVSLPGEVSANPDRLAHVVPRVAGVAYEVRKNQGDRVRAGEVMAVLESRELAALKSTYLAMKERLKLAEVTYAREERLWKQNISSEREYLSAKQLLAETRIDLRGAEQKLQALGFSDPYLAGLSFQASEPFTRYEIAAPFDGTVIEKHIARGEMLKDDAEAFVVADLSSVWVNLTVYQKDLPFVQVGQPVNISAKEGAAQTLSEVFYVSSTINEKTRTAVCRAVLQNSDGQWRPGLFVNGRIIVESFAVPVFVPRIALQSVENKTVVFVQTQEGLEPQPVEVGRANETHVEILSGLRAGQRYVTAGAFTVKAQLSKGEFGDGHSH